MATLYLALPLANEKVRLPLNQDLDKFIINFDISESTIERIDNDFVISFDNGAVISFENFYTIYSPDKIPDFMLDGEILSGEDFFAGLNPDLMPAAGSAEVADDGGRIINMVTDTLDSGIYGLDGVMGASAYKAQSFLSQGVGSLSQEPLDSDLIVGSDGNLLPKPENVTKPDKNETDSENEFEDENINGNEFEDNLNPTNPDENLDNNLDNNPDEDIDDELDSSGNEGNPDAPEGNENPEEDADETTFPDLAPDAEENLGDDEEEEEENEEDNADENQAEDSLDNTENENEPPQVSPPAPLPNEENDSNPNVNLDGDLPMPEVGDNPDTDLGGDLPTPEVTPDPPPTDPPVDPPIDPPVDPPTEPDPNLAPVISGDFEQNVIEAGVGRDEHGNDATGGENPQPELEYWGENLIVSETITITDGNPDDTLDVSFEANNANASDYGTFTLTENADGTYTYTFELNGPASPTLNHGDELELTYTITVDDGNGGTTSKDVVINVLGTNDMPRLSIAPNDNSVTEGSDTTANGSFDVSDVDSEDNTLAEQEITINGTPVDTSSETAETIIDGTYGRLTVFGDGDYRYELGVTEAQKAALENLDAPKDGESPVTEDFTITTTDNSNATDEGKLSIEVTGIDSPTPPPVDPPVDPPIDPPVNPPVEIPNPPTVPDKNDYDFDVEAGNLNDQVGYRDGFNNYLWSGVKPDGVNAYETIDYDHVEGAIIDTAGGNDSVYLNQGSDVIFLGDSHADVYDEGADGILKQEMAQDALELFMTGDDNAVLSQDYGESIYYGEAENRDFNGTINGLSNSYVDMAHSGGGDDIVLGEGGVDLIFGGSGNDQLFGGDGNDGIRGGSGDDMLSGDAGDDILKGGSGNDTIYGGTGNDIIHGGTGDDILIGGSGNDIYAWDIDETDKGNDVILGFTIGEDALDLSGFTQAEGYEVTTSESNGNSIISILKDGVLEQTITLQDVTFGSDDDLDIILMNTEVSDGVTK